MITPEQIKQMAREAGFNNVGVSLGCYNTPDQDIYQSTPEQLAAYTARVIELCKDCCLNRANEHQLYASTTRSLECEHKASACYEMAQKIDALKPTGKED